MDSRLRPLGGCLLALLVLAPAAHATAPASTPTYYVDELEGSDTNFCDVPASDPSAGTANHGPCATIDHAIGLPGAPITISLADGQYFGPSSTPTKFLYITGESSDPSATTILSGTPSNHAGITFSSGGSLANLTVKGDDDPTSPGPGVTLHDDNPYENKYRLSNVDVIAGVDTNGPPASPPSALEAYGENHSLSITVQSSSFSAGQDADTVLLYGSQVSSRIADSSIVTGPDGTGLKVDKGGQATVTGGSVEQDASPAKYGALVNGAGGELRLLGSRIAAGRTALAVTQTGGTATTTATVRDSLLWARAAGFAPDDGAVTASTQLQGQPNDDPHVSVTVVGSTLVNLNPAPSNPNLFPGGAVAYRSGGTVNIALRNTLVYTPHLNGLVAFQAHGDPPGSATITAEHSNFRDPTGFEGGAHPVASGNGNSDADPLLADPANGDFTLLSGSPVIDAGAGSIVYPAETDINGAARALDGDGDCEAIPDIGAYERSAATTCTPKPTLSGDAAQVQGSPKSDTVKPQAIAVFRKKFKLRTALARGLPGKVGSDETSTVVLTAELGSKTAHKLKLAAQPVVVASADARLKPNTMRAVTLKFTRKAKARLRRAKSVNVTLRIQITDMAGNATTVIRRITLKR